MGELTSTLWSDWIFDASQQMGGKAQVAAMPSRLAKGAMSYLAKARNCQKLKRVVAFYAIVALSELD